MTYGDGDEHDRKRLPQAILAACPGPGSDLAQHVAAGRARFRARYEAYRRQQEQRVAAEAAARDLAGRWDRPPIQFNVAPPQTDADLSHGPAREPGARVHGRKDVVAERRPSEAVVIQQVIMQASDGEVPAERRRPDVPPEEVISAQSRLRREIGFIGDMDDPSVRTVCVDGPGCYWVQRSSWRLVDCPALTEERFRRLVHLACLASGHEPSLPQAVVRGSLGGLAFDGLDRVRFGVVRPPASRDGVAKLSFLVPVRAEPPLDRLFASVLANAPRPRLSDVRPDESLAVRFNEALAGRMAVIVSGPPIAERFDFVNLLAKSIPAGRRVVVLEGDDDWSSLFGAPTENCVRLHYRRGFAGMSIEDVVRAAEALRPDHLVIPSVDDMGFDAYAQHIGPAFSGQVIGINAFRQDLSHFPAEPDVVVLIGDNNAFPPLGIIRAMVRRSDSLAAPFAET